MKRTKIENGKRVWVYDSLLEQYNRPQILIQHQVGLYVLIREALEECGFEKRGHIWRGYGLEIVFNVSWEEKICVRAGKKIREVEDIFLFFEILRSLWREVHDA